MQTQISHACLHLRAYLGVKDGMKADVCVLHLEGLDQDVDVIVSHLGDCRLVRVDPRAAHPGFFPDVGLAVKPGAPDHGDVDRHRGEERSIFSTWMITNTPDL